MRHSVPSYHHARKAMTLSELAIVLGAMGIVMGGIWAVSSTVWNSYRYRKANDQLVAVVQSVRSYYDSIGGLFQPGTKTDYGAGTNITPVLDDDDRRLIPIDMRVNPAVEGGDINHALATRAGGSLIAEGLGTAGRTFRVRLLGLSQSNCIRFLMEFPVLTPEMGVTRMGTGTNNTAVDAANVANPGVNLPMTLATALNWCSITATNTNEVNFDFRTRY